MSETPKPENVRFEYKDFARPPSEWAKQQGAIISIFGGSDCPWCDSKMESKMIGSMIAVCGKNPKHIIQWIPWGG